MKIWKLLNCLIYIDTIIVSVEIYSMSIKFFHFIQSIQKNYNIKFLFLVINYSIKMKRNSDF